MKTYIVVWEVSKEMTVQAENEEEAINMVMSGEYEGEAKEGEITMEPEAYEV